jgi:hypothetical protein
MVAPIRKGRYKWKQNFVLPNQYFRFQPYLGFLKIPSAKLFRQQFGGKVYKKSTYIKKLLNKKFQKNKKWNHFI